MLTERDVRAIFATDLPVHRLLLGEEFDTWAIGDDAVAKFALTAYDAAKIALEQRVHPLLRDILGDVVPSIREARPPDHDGLGYIVHDRAIGVQGQTNDGATIEPAAALAADVGRLLARVHAVDAATVFALGLGEHVISFELPTLDEPTIAFAGRTLGDRVDAFLAAEPPAPSARRALCHTDLKGEHVFVAPSRDRVAAIIDWADTEVSDPAQDYAGLVVWLGPAFATAAIRASGEADDESLAERSIWLARAGMLHYWNEVFAEREHAPVELITRQLRTAFGD